MPSFGKPVLVKWDTTERPERIAADTLELLGMEEETIYRVFTRLLGNKTENNAMRHASNPYGDGHTSERIAVILSNCSQEP